MGVWWGLGLKGLEGRGLVGLAEGGGALIDLWVGPVSSGTWPERSTVRGMVHEVGPERIL